MDYDMLNSDEQKNIDLVLTHLRGIDDNDRWDKVDDYMSYLEWIDDSQLMIEVKVLFDKHVSGDPRCTSSHSKENCLVPYLLDAVDCILAVNEEFNSISSGHKYILQYYVTLTAIGEIVS